jgi:hypothetical protein
VLAPSPRNSDYYRIRLTRSAVIRRAERRGAWLGKAPQHLVFDSKLTTYQWLDRLDAAGIIFLTLRRRSPSLLTEVDHLPPSAWRTVTLDLPHRKYRNPRVYEQKACPRQRSYRQFFITDLSHDEPTILLTNDTSSSAKTLIARYAKRMLIENALADAVRFFHIDALSSSVGFKVDFDIALLVLASTLYRLMARRMRGYPRALNSAHRRSPAPDTITVLSTHTALAARRQPSRVDISMRSCGAIRARISARPERVNASGRYITSPPVRGQSAVSMW